MDWVLVGHVNQLIPQSDRYRIEPLNQRTGDSLLQRDFMESGND